ncbi:type IV pilin [Halalkalicoccus subterraneus]|uniref:type IV pilin n=1 Tax=Halalkalicoccus subterraneus TaxID=2675002 RepID=UPI000EFBC82E|nr:type IV pilin N-terminal domain-containing protein [Halalkalicoccus subterraneus]
MARAISPVIGVVLLVACVVLLSATVGAMVLGYEPTQPAAAVAIDGEATADGEITLTLDHGDSLDVRDLSLVVEVDGEPLEKQPTVPAYSQSGFSGFPAGPFNAGTDSEWTRGESASLTIASTTNGPLPEAGSTVTVRVSENGIVIATVEMTVR